MEAIEYMKIAKEEASKCVGTERSLRELILEMIENEHFYKRPKISIIRMYGFDGTEQCTLSQLAKEFNTSKSETGHVFAKALRKLRHPSHSKILREYEDWAKEHPDSPCAKLISDVFGLGNPDTPVGAIIQEKKSKEK